MSNNTESISAKLRSWADDYYEGKYSPIAQARDHYGIDSTVTWQDLSEVFNHIADDIDAEKQSMLRNCAYPLTQEIGKPLKGDEDFKSWLDRYYLPRPLYEDGEPVGFGCELELYGSAREVTAYHVAHDGRCAVNMRDGGTHVFDAGYRFKRPEQVLLADGLPAKVGETVYRTNDAFNPGKETKVYGIGHIQDAPHSPVQIFTTPDCTLKSGWMPPGQLTHSKPVLDANCVPIEVGETVWSNDDALPWDVVNIKDGYPILRRHGGEISIRFDAGYVFHHEPDSLEKLRDDIRSMAAEESGSARDNYLKCADRLTALMGSDA